LLAGTLLVSLWLMRRPASRAARRAVGCWLAFSLIVSTYPLPSAITRLLESGFHVLQPGDLPAGPLAIVVLGSGAVEYRGRDDTRLVHLDSAGAVRVLEAFRVFRMRPDAWVIASGGAIRVDGHAPTTGATMRDALIQLGVPADRIVVEQESQSTRDEAVLVARMLPALNVSQAVVVTQGFHLRRSVAAFRAAGIETIPAITVAPPTTGADWWWPSNRALAFTGVIVRELIANAWYWSRGWA